MIDVTEFKENLGLESIPVELEKLIYFQNHISSFENYTKGFGVFIDNKSGLKTWSNDENFLNRLHPFAQANGSGSFYVIWDDGTDKSIDQMPVAVFGDEGGVHIVAGNMKEFLHLLTYDTEISVEFDQAYFYKDDEEYGDEYWESEDLGQYLEWVEADYGLGSIENPDEVIKNAQNNYKESFDQWLKQYFEW